MWPVKVEHGVDGSYMRDDAQSPIAMSFPTSNFNARLHLVRYGFLPVFPVMSPQESRTLVCILKGNPLAKPYDIFDIPICANVFRSRAAIQDRIKRLHDIDADSLQLRKVVSLIPGACAF
jgi:hypothetical protein